MFKRNKKKDNSDKDKSKELIWQKVQTDNLVEVIQDSQKEVQNLQIQLNTANQAKEQAQTANDNLQAQLDQVKNENSSLIHEVSNLRSLRFEKLKKLRVQIQNKDKDIKDLLQANKNLQNQLTAKNQSKAQNEINQLIEQLVYAIDFEGYALFNLAWNRKETKDLKELQSDFKIASDAFRRFQNCLKKFAESNPEFQERFKYLGRIETYEKRAQADNLIKTIADLQLIEERKTEAEKNLQSALEELTKNQNYVKELEAEKLSAYDQFSTEYAFAMEDFYKRQGVNTGNYQEHLKDYSFFKRFKEQTSKEFLELNRENQELKQNNEDLEEQVKALSQLKEIEFKRLKEAEFKEMEAKIQEIPGSWKWN